MTQGHSREVTIKYLCIKTKKVSALLKKRERGERIKERFQGNNYNYYGLITMS